MERQGTSGDMGIAVMIRSAGLGLALFASCATSPATPAPQEEERDWSCQKDFQEARGVLRVNKELTPEGKHTVYTVGFRSSSGAQEETDLFWIVPPSGDWFGRLDRANFSFVFPAALREGPVMAHVYEDGVLVSTQKILDDSWIKNLPPDSRVQGRLTFDTPEARAALRLHGTSALIVAATGPDARELARAHFLLPDWARADRLVKSAMAELDHDALDYRHHCGQQGEPIEELPVLVRRRG